MSKVNAEKSLAVKTENYLPSAEVLEKDVVMPSGNAFFPYLEMVFPIMQSPDKPEYDEHEWEIGFKNGGTFVPLEVGTVLTVLDIRNVIKRTYEDDKGTKNEYAYAPITRGAGDTAKVFNATQARYEELLPDAQNKGISTVNLGTSMVTIVIFPDGRTAVCDFAVFKTMNGYITPVLAPAKIQKCAGLRLDIQNHKQNLTKAKTSGFFYPSIKKFGQWEHVQLTPEQAKAAMAAFNEVKDSYMNWLNQ